MDKFPIDLLRGCFTFFEEEIRFSTCPKKNKKNLEKEMNKLKRIQGDVTTIFKEQKQTRPGTECEVVVKSWLDAVNGIETEVNTLLDDLKKTSSCTCCCFPSHNYFLGKEVVRLIDQVHSLVEERRSFDDKNLVRPIPYDPINNVPDLPTTMVGRDGKSTEIHGYLRDSQVTTIGIWGRGGIGKTTMLKSIKQWLSENDHDFQYIIWIEMFQNNIEDDILRIQKQIASCIFLSLPSEHEEKENARMLANALRSRKSLLLIDNVWKKLDFERIGIPFVKILLTTRSEGVCNDMRAQKIVCLDSLDEAESLQLFQGNISPVVDLTDMIVRQRVVEILRRCGGVPLVIVTVARTVANYTEVEEWDDAVECLRSSREEIKGMDEIMKRLKFSYDKLEDDKIKSCLLYLSLYPEGKLITIDKLIKEWVAEGFLDTPNDNSFTRSYRRGVKNINKLKSICLVEKSVISAKVKLHDEIRHMLCWIREHENKEVFIVYNDDYKSNIGKISDSNYDRWDLAKRIFLLEGQVKRLPETGIPLCPNLTSLLVQHEYFSGNRIDKLPTEDFFHFTPSLRVLDLSYTGLVDIPKSIGELVELRYLNLFRTRIHTLPMELANLKKLKCLDLGDTSKLGTIVGSAISQLSVLQCLNLFNTSYQWESDDVNMTTQPPLLKLEDLRALKNLEDLGVDLWSNSHLDTILFDEMFLKSIARISFIQIDFTTIDLGGLQLIEWISKRLPELKYLIVDRCALATDILEIKDDQLPLVTQLYLRRLEIWSVALNDASRPFSRLKILQIFGCQRLKEVSWTARIPFLEELLVYNCNSVKELVEEEEEELREERDYFPKLVVLDIKHLENLERIYGSSPLLFPALRRLRIENCPKLKELSFGDESAKNLEFIKCEEIQWDLLEWENDQVQAKFLPYFIPFKIVYNDMRAQKIVPLDSLDKKESLELFQGNISPDVDLTDMIICERVDEILTTCGGVPLVILTVARTVANYTQVEEWNDAVECLRSYEGMNDVLKPLKFSYDKLEDDKIKSCLLYLSLYPEGFPVTTDYVIKQWVAEGFLDTPNDNSFTRSYRRGVVNINKLKSICLVEKSVYSEDYVKLNGVIRDMLCWIREHENKEVCIVYNDEINNCNYDRWDLAKGICLFEGQLKGLPEEDMPSCPNLTNLILLEAEDYSSNRRFFPTEDFFHFTPSLRVLDLSCTGLVDIPKSIGELVELRYLNLYGTLIHTLPMELANLKKLKFLDLGETFKLVTIVGSAISQLSSLQSLNLCKTSYQWDLGDVVTTEHPLLKLEDLRALKNLEDLGVDVWSNSHLVTILWDHMLLKSITRICFNGIDFTTVDLGERQLIEWISYRLPKLMNLIVFRCALVPDNLEIKDDQLPLVTELQLQDLKISSVTLRYASRPLSRLKVLQIIGCQWLKEVSWTARIPFLEELLVENCNSVKELVEEQEEEEEEEIREERDYFPKLSRLGIKDLANLERIQRRSPLLFPALRRLFIENCPKLKQLCFGDDSAKNNVGLVGVGK